MTTISAAVRRLRVVLIGRRFSDHRRSVVVLIGLVAPVVALTVVAIELAETGRFGHAVGSGTRMYLVVAATSVAVTGVVFVVFARHRNRHCDRVEPTPWRSPATRVRLSHAGPGRKGALVAAASNIVAMLVVGWQYLARPWQIDGAAQGISVLNPELWPAAAVPVLAGLAVLAGFQLLRSAGRARSVPAAAGYTLAKAMVAVPLVLALLHQRVFHPEFLIDINGFVTEPSVFYSLVAAGVIVGNLTAVVNRIRAATHGRSSADGSVPCRRSGTTE